MLCVYTATKYMPNTVKNDDDDQANLSDLN